jgi:uncharacterized Zn-finger protein
MVVTKADVYEKVIFAERPVCPYCGNEMKVWAPYQNCAEIVEAGAATCSHCGRSLS